ncbi:MULTISPECIES: hypothetical protein [unclassified Pseudoalteromonas]|uniref:hypothetical protein n=1 Tax=unclassified Pseudoalteromonas TaxID=194690 RepID=UPI0007300763|nr:MULTISPECIES: hypothetical protein [unclassified Pseudoalteromonas]KTD95750.1 hypothetical protein ATS71_05625 [Pseudoalteromonas sp. H71]TMN80704.1 hypothetical protein CWB64_13610 [Pseudoalteromonas sp. S410]TMN89707.1 hypothetical protein CWB62_11720 [Pseudoalteromonas sp. S408]TMN97320.1 hypothetical protein CWB61_09860 [Pseudoalteromonas sp. S407]TMO02328.1 hypothetical protein CWB63_01335 [Pseudoalteromonas sp. S409]
MKPLLHIITFIGLLLPSYSALADFSLPGKGTITYSTGIQKNFEFGFAWQQKAEQFKIGAKSYAMQSIPSSYSVAITLSKDESQVWVQEFNNGFIEGFNWQIGEHTVSLKKQMFSDRVKGDYVIELNNRSYFFTRNNASIVINFNEDGIETIAIDGVTKNMGTKN